MLTVNMHQSNNNIKSQEGMVNVKRHKIWIEIDDILIKTYMMKPNCRTQLRLKLRHHVCYLVDRMVPAPWAENGCIQLVLSDALATIHL